MTGKGLRSMRFRLRVKLCPLFYLQGILMPPNMVEVSCIQRLRGNLIEIPYAKPMQYIIQEQANA